MRQTLVSLDLEMTGPRPENQEIIEIAAVKFRGSQILDTWSTLVNPHCQIPLSIQVLTGISQKDVDRAPSLSEVAPYLRAFVGDDPLVAHTVSSDVGCLERKGIRLKNLQLDTYELATVLLPQVSSYSLASLSRHFGIDQDRQHHRAADDALLTKELFVHLLEVASELDLGILQEINRLTANVDWPLKLVFQEVERDKSMQAFSGVSIRQQLAAKEGLHEATLELTLLGRRGAKPLVPSRIRRPLDVEALTEVLGPKGPLAQRFPGYEYRPQQVQMMREVAEALNRGGQLVVEAGTGTGKSIAYLLPAAQHAYQNGERVVISTNTINLQDQLLAKDIPDLLDALSLGVKAAVLKGRSNYLCMLRWSAMRHRSDLTFDEMTTLVKLLAWLPNTTTGDVAEINLSERQRPVWHKLCASLDACPGARCQHLGHGSCFLFRARSEAESAHLVIVNHALLLSDVAANSQVLPEYRHLVIDEAHHLEDEATNQLGFSVRQQEVLGHLDSLSQVIAADRRAGLLSEIRAHFRGSSVPPAAVQEIDGIVRGLHERVDAGRQAAMEFYAALSQFAREHAKGRQGYDSRLRLTAATRAQPAWSTLEETWEKLSLRLADISEGLSRLQMALADLEGHNVLDYDSLVAEVGALLSFEQELRSQVGALISSPQVGRIYWLSIEAQTGSICLNAAPLAVDDLLRQFVYDSKDTVVLTSATLSAAGSCQYVKSRLGLPEARELIVSSPFDYKRSTLILVPTDIPEPERPNYQQGIQQSLIGLCTATEGRALVLFTSHSQLRQTFHAIRGPLEERGILVLGHGIEGGGRRQLLSTLRSNARTVLLGAASFWEGVDVVGDALSLLVIVRLPFNVPTDPVFAARSETFDDPFNQFSVPQTILRFKQGFGRLIRSQSDRGVLAVLDRRVQTKPYGAAFIRSLPPCTLKQPSSRDLPDLAREWLMDKRAREAAAEG